MFSLFFKTPKRQFFKFSISLLLILTTVFGILNLVNPQTALAQALLNSTQNPSLIGKETASTDINLVEQNTDSNYKFGDRIEASKFAPAQIKNDICGKSIDFSNSKLGSKFDPKAISTVIKILKTKCLNSGTSSSQISKSWLKLVWDNGLIGWVEIPTVQKVAQKSQFENLLNFGSIQTLAQTNTGIKKTCSDFQFQVRDLSVLNQFPNLDLDDDGVGCEHLKPNPNDQFTLDISVFDTDKNGKITCSDFPQIIHDLIILARFPNLDGDKDGVGCESNKINPNYAANPAFDPNSEDFTDIEKTDFELTLDENTVDLGDLTRDLSQVLNADWQYLEANDQSCGSIICPIQSLSGLGRRGLWTFHFVAGLLQGAGQSIVDLFGQIWNLVTKTGEVISEIIKGVKAILSDSKLLLKLLQDSMLDLIGTDTMGRANLIGKAVGGFVPDVILAFVTVGAGVAAKNSLTALKTSGKLASVVIKFEKFIGRNIKIINGKYQFFLKKAGQGVGIAGEVKAMLQKMQAAEVEKLLTKVTDQNKLRLLRFYVEGYQLVKKGYKILGSDFNHILQRHSSGTMDKVDKFLQGA